MSDPIVWFPTTAEARTIAALDHIGYSNRGLSVRQWERVVNCPNSLVVCAGRDYLDPLGFILIQSITAEDAQLSRLVVLPDERRAGLGRWLVQAVGERHALDLELRERSTEALAFAKAVGFVALHLSRGRFGDCDGIELRRPADKPAAAVG